MVVPVITAAAATKGAATIAISEKAAKATASAFTSIEETTKLGGFDQLERFSSQIQSSAPALALGQTIMGQLTAGTAEGSMRLFKEVLELMQSPEGQASMGKMVDFFNTLLEIGTMLVGTTNDLNENAGVLSKIFSDFGAFLRLLIGIDPFTALTDFWNLLKEIIDWLENLTWKSWQSPTGDQRPGSGPILGGGLY